MTVMTQLFRWVMVLCLGAAHIAALPEVSFHAASLIRQQSHEVFAVEHEGHQDLVFHHRDAEQAAECGHHELELESEPGHRHGDHVLHVMPDEGLNAPEGVMKVRAPELTLLAELVLLLPQERPVMALAAAGERWPAPPDEIVRVMRTVVLLV